MARRRVHKHEEHDSCDGEDKDDDASMIAMTRRVMMLAWYNYDDEDDDASMV